MQPPNGIDVFCPGSGRGEIRRPVGIPEQPDPTDQVITDLPGGRGVVFGQVIGGVGIVHLHGDDLPLFHSDHSHCSDEPPRGADFVLVLDQHQIGLGTEIWVAQQFRQGIEYPKTITKEGQIEIELLHQRARFGREATKVDQLTGGQGPVGGLHPRCQALPASRKGCQDIGDRGVLPIENQTGQQRGCGLIALVCRYRQGDSHFDEGLRGGKIPPVDRQPAQQASRPAPGAQPPLQNLGVPPGLGKQFAALFQHVQRRFT